MISPISVIYSSLMLIHTVVRIRLFQRPKHVEPTRDSAMAAYEACRRKRSPPVEAAQDDGAADLQLSLSPTTVTDAKKRKTTAPSEQEIMDASELPISLSLSPPAAASMQKQQQQKTRGSNDSTGSGEAVLGQSTLDLTMSIRALE